MRKITSAGNLCFPVNLSMVLKFIFKYIIVIAIAQEIDQPARWPKIDQDHEFFATKSVLNAAKGLFQN